MKKPGRGLAHNSKMAKQSIECGETDITLFNDIRSKSTTLLKDVEEMSSVYTAYTELQQDTYNALFKYEPELKEEHKIDFEFIANRMLMEKLMELPRYREMRVATQLEPINAAVGTQSISGELKELVKEMAEELKKLKEAGEAASGQGNQPGSNQGDGEDGEEGDEDGNGKSHKKQTAAEAMKEYEKQIKNVQEVLDRKKTESQLTAMLAGASKKIKETSDFIQQWGLGGSDSFTQMSLQDQLAYVNKLQDNPILKKIADLGRRLTFMALNMEKEQVNYGMSSIVDVELGSELDKLLPEELMMFSIPAMKMDFFARLMDGNCLQLKQEDKERKQRGPLCVCVDQSGSMSGDPFVFATSVSMALLQICANKKRSCVLIPFSSGSSWDKLKVFEFPKNEPQDPETLIQAALYFEGGGTDFIPPLMRARNYIDKELDFDKADIIFITDGEAGISQEFLDNFNKWKEERKVFVHTILIDAGCSSPSIIDKFSDKYDIFSSMLGESNIKAALSIFDHFIS